MVRAYEVHANLDMAAAAARHLSAVLQQAVRRRGRAHVALSGGSSPRRLFQLLAAPAWRERIPWTRVHVWWVDERCVPPEDHESNYGAAYALLLRHLPGLYVHRMRGERADPAAAAREYEADLRQAFGLGPAARPRFDFILLGMGADGHTASLFPGTAALRETQALVTVGQAPTSPTTRLTLTLPVLNRAAFALFYVTGANKGPALARVFAERDDSDPLPAALVQPTRGRLLWLLDDAAASAGGLPLAGAGR